MYLYHEKKKSSVGPSSSLASTTRPTSISKTISTDPPCIERKEKVRFSTIQWVRQYLNREENLHDVVDQVQAKLSASRYCDCGKADQDQCCCLTPINILCMDGGGMRGFALSAMCEEITKIAASRSSGGSSTDAGNDNNNKKDDDHDNDFLDYFDLVAGTSVGGAAALVAGHTGESTRTIRICHSTLERTRDEAFRKRSCRNLFCKGFLLRNDNRDKIFQEEIMGGKDKPLLNEDPNHLKAFALCCLREQKKKEEESSSLNNNKNNNNDELSGNTSDNAKTKKYKPFLVRTYEAVRHCAAVTVKPEEASAHCGDQGMSNSSNTNYGENNDEANMKDTKSVEASTKNTTIIEDEKEQFLPGTCDILLHQALTATSAAPVVCDRLDIVVDGEKKRLADGGCISNSPIAIAIHEAKALWPDRPIGIILSLGLNQYYEDELNCQAVEYARKSSPNLMFVRLSPPLEEFSPFGTNPKQTEKIMNVAKEYLRNSKEAADVIEKIMSTRPRRHRSRRRISRFSLVRSARLYRLRNFRFSLR